MPEDLLIGRLLLLWSFAFVVGLLWAALSANSGGVPVALHP